MKGKLKLLVSADVLMDTLTNLTGCVELLECSTFGTERSLKISAVCYMLNAITENFQKEIRASLDAEEEMQKRNRKRNTREERQK